MSQVLERVQPETGDLNTAETMRIGAPAPMVPAEAVELEGGLWSPLGLTIFIIQLVAAGVFVAVGLSTLAAAVFSSIR